jgi:hypothetical protein
MDTVSLYHLMVSEEDETQRQSEENKYGQNPTRFPGSGVFFYQPFKDFLPLQDCSFSPY